MPYTATKKLEVDIDYSYLMVASDSFIISNTMNTETAGRPDHDMDFATTIFQRIIEFHAVRKPYNGFINNRNNGFKLVTLNPQLEPGKDAESVVRFERSEGSENFGLDPELSLGITFRRIKHVNRALQSTGRILEPKDLVSNLCCISRNFRNVRQEDVDEYMVNLLESMHKCCLPKGVHSESHTAYEKSLIHKIFGGCLRSQHLDGGARQYQCQECKEKCGAPVFPN